MITKIDEKYGVLYFLSNYLEVNIVVFNKIRTVIDNKSNLG
jgi:hypothetical protein